MLNFIRKPFGYEPILTKEDLKKSTKKKVEKASDWKGVLSRIWKLVDEQRFLLIIVLLLVVVSSALSLLGPYMIGIIIDKYITQSVFVGLAKMIGLLVIVYVFLSISLYMQSYWMIGIAQQTIYRLRTGLFKHLQKLPVSFFDKRQHGEL